MTFIRDRCRNLKEMINRITLLLFIFTIFSCKNPNEKSDLQIYNQKSAELINQILKSEKIECSCLLEMPHRSLVEIMDISTPSRNNREDLKNALKITSDSIFEKQNELSKQFRIFSLNLYLNDMNLLNLSQLDSIQQNLGNQNYDEVLWKKCPSGILTISPPVFNDTYDMAVIEISSCSGGGVLGIYNLINGGWEYLSQIYVWLS